MSVPPERLLETQAESKAVTARISALENSRKSIDITQEHINEEQKLDQSWQGVGKAFFRTSTEEYKTDSAKQAASSAEQIAALQKKKDYYQTTWDKMSLDSKQQK